MKFSVCLEKRIVVEVEAKSLVLAKKFVLQDEDTAFFRQEWDKAEGYVEDIWETA